MARGPSRPPDAPAGAAPWLQLYLDLAAVGIAFAALAGLVLWQEGVASIAGGLLAVGLLVLLPAARRLGARWGDARLAIATTGIALLMWGGQVADGIITAVGMDVFGAGEKHVVPSLLIDAAATAGLPEPFASYPAATVLLPLKVGLASLAAWMVGVRAAHWWPEAVQLRSVVLLAVAYIGAGPALRNLLRMAMGV